RVAVEKGHRQLVEAKPIARGVEPVPRRARREWNEEPRVGPCRVKRRGCLQYKIAVHVELGHPAAREKRKYWLRNAELQLLARFPLRRERGRVLRQWMPNKRHGHARLRVDRRFERIQREDSVDRAANRR